MDQVELVVTLSRQGKVHTIALLAEHDFTVRRRINAWPLLTGKRGPRRDQHCRNVADRQRPLGTDQAGGMVAVDRLAALAVLQPGSNQVVPGRVRRIMRRTNFQGTPRHPIQALRTVLTGQQRRRAVHFRIWGRARQTAGAVIIIHGTRNERLAQHGKLLLLPQPTLHLTILRRQPVQRQRRRRHRQQQQGQQDMAAGAARCGPLHRPGTR